MGLMVGVLEERAARDRVVRWAEAGFLFFTAPDCVSVSCQCGGLQSGDGKGKEGQ